MPLTPGAVIAQKYRLEAPLARGGMGAVWTARHVTLGHEVAVKFLDPRLAGRASFQARFEREARAAATIQSPHVVHVHDFGMEEDGTPYIVMELLRGEDLRSRIRRVGRLSLAETAGLLVQVGKGLRRAHEAGIVHRDIKPGNLFLARADDEEVLKILDFGIAKENDQTLDEHTKTGELVGSPHYVSPEQARGEKDLDHRSDVWSTGVIAYRMVTGHLPFPGEGLGQVLSKVLTAAPPKVGSLVPGLPGLLDDFFARALAKKKEERFQTVRELVDAFVELVRQEGSEESVPPPSWSTIVNVSLPPPAPVPAGLPAPILVKPGEKTSAVSLGSGDLLPSHASEAASAPSHSSAPPQPRDGKRDSLVPAMAAKQEQPPPVVRFRWATAVAICVSVVVTVAVAWYRDHASTAPSTSASEIVTAPVATPAPPPLPPPPKSEARPALPPHSAPALSGAPKVPPIPADPSNPASASTANNMTAGAPTNAPQARPTGTLAPGSVPTAAATKRKWGF